MRRKRRATKKAPQKKATPSVTTDRLNGLSTIVAHYADENFGLEKTNDNNKLGGFVALSKSSSSSSSLGGSDESLNVKLSAEPAHIRVTRSVTKHGQPSKVEVLKKGADVIVNSSKGLNSSSRKQSQPMKLHQNPMYNKKELKASLAVINKVMEMDEAASFSAPVDPVALGIPDYFEVIDIPMDFGTICSNIQNEVKYLNSEDVYKDVQYIWRNCLRFNKKGDYIVYLMKRVKKKFDKYWTSSGLYSPSLRKDSEPSQDNSTRHGITAATLVDKSRSGKPNQVHKDANIFSQAHSQVPCPSYSMPHQPLEPTVLMDNSRAGFPSQVQKDNYGINQAHSQAPLPSYSSPYQPFQPQSSTSPAAPFQQLQGGADSHLAGLSHLVAYIDHAIRSSRAGPTLMDSSLGNPTQMQNDNFGTSQLHSQAPPSSYSQFHQLQQPQPNTNQVAQSSQLETDRERNHAELPPSKNITKKHKKDTTKDANAHLVCGLPYSKQRQPQKSSYNVCQSQQGNSHLKPTQSHVGTNVEHKEHPHLTSHNTGATIHDGCSKRYPRECPVISSPVTPHQPPWNQSLLNKSNQPQASSEQPHPSRLARVDISNAGNSSLPTTNDKKRRREHLETSSEEPGSESSLDHIQSLPHQSTGSDNEQYQSQQTKKRNKRGRGPTRLRFMWDMPEWERIVVPVNTLGQPVGAEASKLASFLGTVARNGKMVPLTFPTWHAMPDERKEEMWELVLTKFDIDPICKSWVLKSIANKWRNWKARLKADHYYAHKTDEERLKDRDRRIVPEQWETLVSLWSNEELQSRCEKNRANRAKQRVTHASGSKSFARLREEEREKRPDGSEPTRAELFIKTRTRKNGQPVNEKAAEMISKLTEAAQKQSNPRGINDGEDTFSQVMGEEYCGHVLMYGLGPTPSDLRGQKRSNLQLMRAAAEAKKATNAEVSKLMTKMEVMEQKYASMEAQITRMTSSMQNFLEKMSGPSKTLEAEQVHGPSNAKADSLQRQEHSSSSSHAG